MMKAVAVAAMVMRLVAGCTDVDPNAPDPNPWPGEPAPHADPRPSGSPRRHYLRFQYQNNQPVFRQVEFEWKFEAVTPPVRKLIDPEYHADFDTTQNGIAKLTVESTHPGDGTNIYCAILYRNSPEEDWRLLDELWTFPICEVVAVIN